MATGVSATGLKSFRMSVYFEDWYDGLKIQGTMAWESDVWICSG